MASGAMKHQLFCENLAGDVNMRQQETISKPHVSSDTGRFGYTERCFVHSAAALLAGSYCLASVLSANPATELHPIESSKPTIRSPREGVRFGESEQPVAATVRVAGTTSQTALNADSHPIMQLTTAFEFVLQGDTYECRTTFDPDHYEVVTFDGTYVYHQLVTPGVAADHPIPVLVRRGPYPVDGFATTRILWFVLTSRSPSSDVVKGAITALWGHAAMPGAEAIS